MKRPRSDRGFTLIELLVIIAIMGVMATVGIVSFNSGKASTRVFAATRDVIAMIRRARSTALVTQKPVVIVYSNGKTGDDESFAKVEIQAAKLFNSKKEQGVVRNLAGDIVGEGGAVEDGGGNGKNGGKYELVHIRGKESEKDEGAVSALDDEKGGETLEDVMSPESIPEGVTAGLKLKVLNDNEVLQLEEKQHSRISIFSTADNISRTYQAGKDVSSGASASATAAAEAEEATEEAVRVVFAANGTVEPAHKIWIYPEDKNPEKGLCIEVDRFGDVKCTDLEGK